MRNLYTGTGIYETSSALADGSFMEVCIQLDPFDIAKLEPHFIRIGECREVHLNYS
jgi:hypothetical protein